MKINLNALPKVIHPFMAGFTLSDAVNLAINIAEKQEYAPPSSLREVREHVTYMVTRNGYNWSVGIAALDVLDAAIDGKDLSLDCRYH